MAATICKTNLGESRGFKKMVAISGVGTKSIFEGAFPYCKQVQQFFARFDFCGSRTTSQKPPKSKNCAIFMIHGTCSRFPVSVINSFVYVPQQFLCVVVQYLDLDSWITHHVVKPAIKTSRFFVFLSHFFDSWIERGIHILESSKKLLYGKAPSNIDFVQTPEIVTTLFLKPRDSPNTKNLTRFMIEYGLSVGSKCNSLKSNQAFKDKLGCPRAIHYLTPPPTRYVLGRCPCPLSTCNPYL